MPLGIESACRAVFNRARKGLYAGRVIKFGNKVSEDGGNKSRRSWKPNVQWKRVYSITLERMLRLRMTTHAMRCIDKAGGVDLYLLNTSPEELNSEVGMKLRREIERKSRQNKNKGVSYLIDIQNAKEENVALEAATVP